MDPCSGNLFHNLLLFGRMLRGLGMDVDPGRMIELVQALELIDIRKRSDFYHTLRCLLVHRRDEIPIFDLAFELFWRKPEGQPAGMAVTAQGSLQRSRKPVILPPPLHPPEGKPPAPGQSPPPRPDEPPLVQATQTYSDREALRSKNFADLSPEEVDSIRQLIANLDWDLDQHRSHRFQPGQSARADLRRTWRSSLRYGGEILEWSYKQAKCRPRPLVILADISGSMERYSRLLLHFAYGMRQGMRRDREVFVFSTRLTRITRPLSQKNVEQALRQVSNTVPDWSGGTRIGEAIKDFNFGWGKRVLGHGAVVLLISDGWDCGDPNLLRQEIARLQRSCSRLIWLNPLLGTPGYEPLTRGMLTALPYVDDFLPVHNLASLEDLAGHLRHLDERHSRKQRVTAQPNR